MYRMFWVTFSQKCVTMGTQVFKTKPTTIFYNFRALQYKGMKKTQPHSLPVRNYSCGCSSQKTRTFHPNICHSYPHIFRLCLGASCTHTHLHLILNTVLCHMHTHTHTHTHTHKGLATESRITCLLWGWRSTYPVCLCTRLEKKQKTILTEASYYYRVTPCESITYIKW